MAVTASARPERGLRAKGRGRRRGRTPFPAPRVAVGLGALAGSTGACTLRRDGDRLSGQATGLLDGAGATHLLLAMPEGGLALLAADAPGVTLRPRPSLDRLRPLAD